jgi:hypothetical protein
VLYRSRVYRWTQIHLMLQTVKFHFIKIGGSVLLPTWSSLSIQLNRITKIGLTNHRAGITSTERPPVTYSSVPDHHNHYLCLTDFHSSNHYQALPISFWLPAQKSYWTIIDAGKSRFVYIGFPWQLSTETQLWRLCST